MKTLQSLAPLCATSIHAEKDEKDDEKSTPISEKLLKTRQLFLSGGVDSKLAKQTIMGLLALEADDPEKDITLFVNSPGGSVNDGFAIYDTIRFIKPRVKIVASGLCASIATVILIAAAKKDRLAMPNTRLLIHQPLIPMQVYGPASDLEITATEIIKTREKINALLAEECGQDLDRVIKDTQRDYWMDAEGAVKYGLVTRIITERAELDD
jgi:ATP-dependent Clp protease protease subunit